MVSCAAQIAQGDGDVILARRRGRRRAVDWQLSVAEVAAFMTCIMALDRRQLETGVSCAGLARFTPANRRAGYSDSAEVLRALIVR